MKRAGLLELNAVVAVATHRNFRAAAVELEMSPSALSHAIAALEARMGVRLFNRTTRSVSPSEAGEQFLTRVAPALKEISEAMAAANDFRETPAGTLRINTSIGAAEQIMQPVFLEFMRRYPDMKLDIVCEGRLVDIVADGFDAGIRLAEYVPQDMIAVPMGPDMSMAVFGSADYFKAHGIPQTPQDLMSHENIRLRLPSGKIYRWEFARHGEEVTVDVPGRFTLDAASLIVETALAGMGVGFLNLWPLREHLQSGRLVRVLEDWCPEFPGLRLYYPRHRHVSAGLRAFITLLQERNTARKKPHSDERG